MIEKVGSALKKSIQGKQSYKLLSPLYKAVLAELQKVILFSQGCVSSFKMLSPFYKAAFSLSPGAMSGGGNTVCKGKMGSALVQDVDPKELNTMENTLEKVRTWVFWSFW